MSRRDTKRSFAGVALLLTTLAGVGGFALLNADPSTAAAGCCSGHQGVCDCKCCDGKPLSEKCRARMPACGGKSSAAVAKGKRRKDPPPVFQGSVVRVLDGDTIEVMHAGAAERIRLAEIDCPEKAQPFGEQAKKFTAGLTSGKTVSVKVRTVDRYGRTVAEVFLPDGTSLNAAILQAGFAWWYRDYSDDKRLGVVEEEARRARRGLWADVEPTPPWVFRRRD